MNRRQMVLLPGAALLATEAFAQTTETARTPVLTGHKALKYASKYGKAKYSYKVPKSAAKQAKYISFLSSLLSLSASQQQAAASIFSTAIGSRTALRAQVQSAHATLGEAVKTNNTAVINQASASIGALGAQKRSYGALANASFYQILSGAQQSTLAQFQTKHAAA